jgi:hypothetical protein
VPMTGKVAPLPTIVDGGRKGGRGHGNHTGSRGNVGRGTQIDDIVRGAWWRSEGDGAEGAGQGLWIPWRPCGRGCRSGCLIVGGWSLGVVGTKGSHASH